MAPKNARTVVAGSTDEGGAGGGTGDEGGTTIPLGWVGTGDEGGAATPLGWVGTGEEEAWEANACWRKDQPTQPAQTTAATIPLIRNRLALSTVDKRRRVRPQSSASRIRARRTATDSSSWVS